MNILLVVNMQKLLPNWKTASFDERGNVYIKTVHGVAKELGIT